MKTCFFTTAVTLTLLTLSSQVLAQNLNLNQLQADVPQGWGGPAAAAAPAAAGTAGYGYQFQYGSFSVHPGSPPTIDAIFTLTTQQFPQGISQKLYHEQLEYVGSVPSGANQGAVFQCTINGNTRHFLFGTVSQGTQNGVELRKLKYFDQNGVVTFSSNVRFYAP